MQPIFHGCESVGGSVADTIFRDGLCLPSGSNLSEDDLFRVVGNPANAPQEPSVSVQNVAA